MQKLINTPGVTFVLQTKLSSKAPFSQYSQLERQGATVTWGSPTDPSTWPKGDFEVVYDNNGKDLESCKPLIDQHMCFYAWTFFASMALGQHYNKAHIMKVAQQAPVYMHSFCSIEAFTCGVLPIYDIYAMPLY
eukprot:1157357-Pelagomonas_calceolata.AAC.5